MEENKVRCVYCGDYKDTMTACPKCGKPVCTWCLSGHLSDDHNFERGERERDDDRW